MIPVRFPVISGFTHPVSPLRAGLYGFWGAWLRYNSLEWNTTIPRRYALPCTPKTAHSNPSNCGF